MGYWLGGARAPPPSPAQAPRPAVAVCRGSDLDIDDLAASCAVHEAPRSLSVTGLLVELVPSQIDVESGGETAIAVQMLNATTRPLTLDLVIGCDDFEISTYAGEGRTRVDVSPTAACSGPDVGCRRGDPLRVTLEVGGRLRKRLTFAARVHTYGKWRGACVREEGSSLAPGRYVARVRLPLPADASSAPPEDRPRSRSVEARVNITPVRAFPGRTGGPS